MTILPIWLVGNGCTQFERARLEHLKAARVSPATERLLREHHGDRCGAVAEAHQQDGGALQVCPYSDFSDAPRLRT